MSNYTKAAKKAQSVPQTTPIPGKSMIRNDAGGFVFETPWNLLLDRILIFGSSAQTYYVDSRTAYADAEVQMRQIFHAHGLEALARIREIREQNLSPKLDALFHWTALATHKDFPLEVRYDAWATFHSICKTASHMFSFVNAMVHFHGWNRSSRRNIGEWYTEKELEQLAFQMTKYRVREGYSHRRVLKMAHPTPPTQGHSNLFAWAVGNTEDMGEGLSAIATIQNFERAQRADKAELITMIEEMGRNFPQEWVPKELSGKPDVVQALLPNMPAVALFRNLGRLSKAGAPPGLMVQALNDTVNPELFQSKYGVHPFQVLLAYLTYQSGRGTRSAWEPSSPVLATMAKAMNMAYSVVEPSNKRLLIAVDTSGSMGGHYGYVPTSPLTPIVSAMALAWHLFRAFPNSELVGVDTNLRQFALHSESGLDAFLGMSTPGGGTNLGLPYTYALKKGDHDGTIMVSDMETWAGTRHVVQIMENLNRSKPDMKHVMVSLTGRTGSLTENDNPNLMEVVGLDSSAVRVVDNFFKA